MSEASARLRVSFQAKVEPYRPILAAWLAEHDTPTAMTSESIARDRVSHALRDHFTSRWYDDTLRFECSCGEPVQDHAAHLADVLAAAGLLR